MTALSSDDGVKRAWLDGPFFILFIAALMGILSLSLDIFLPVLPEISAEFALTDPARVRTILTVFIVAFGLGHLFVGVLADRFGRRPVLLTSLGIFIATGTLCAYATTFETLLVGRFLQGVAAAGPRVIAVAISRDLKSGPALARTLSFAMMIFMAAPIIAPFVGDVVASSGGWRAVFCLLSVMALPVVLVVLLALPETCPPDRRIRLNRERILLNLGRMAATAQTTGNTAICALIYGVMFGFIGIAPIIYSAGYGITTGFAGYFATLGAGIALAAFANARLVMLFGSARILTGGLFALTGIAGVFLITCIAEEPPFWMFHLFMVLLMSAKGLVFANCNALAVEPHRAFAGFASSMIGGTTMLGSGLLAHGIGGLYNGALASLAFAYCIIGAVAATIALAVHKTPSVLK